MVTGATKENIIILYQANMFSMQSKMISPEYNIFYYMKIMPYFMEFSGNYDIIHDIE